MLLKPVFFLSGELQAADGWRGVSSAAKQPMESLARAHMSFSGQFLMTDIDVW